MEKQEDVDLALTAEQSFHVHKRNTFHRQTNIIQVKKSVHPTLIKKDLLQPDSKALQGREVLGSSWGPSQWLASQPVVTAGPRPNLGRLEEVGGGQGEGALGSGHSEGVNSRQKIGPELL